MSKSFYNFIIEELLVSFFSRVKVSPGEKFYFMIEDEALRKDFCQAMQESKNSELVKLEFKEEEGFENTSEAVEFSVLKCGDETRILVSDCDSVNDGLQTKIRNSIGVETTPIADMAALFILPGSNALETLLSAGHNLQTVGYPLHVNYVVDSVLAKVESIINEYEREYLSAYLGEFKDSGDYTSLFDFASILSLLQKKSVRENFSILGAFKDEEIYDPKFSTSNIKARVEENRKAYARVCECMSETYEDAQRTKLKEFLDPKLVRKILENPDDWQTITSWKEVFESIQTQKENAVLQKPDVKILGCAQYIKRTDGSDKTSKTYIILCVQNDEQPIIKLSFNKKLKEYNLKGDGETNRHVLTIIAVACKSKIDFAISCRSSLICQKI